MKYIAGSLWGSVETAAAGEAHPIWFENRPQIDVNGNINGAIELREDCFFCGGFVQNGTGFFMRGGDAFYGEGRSGDYTGTAVDNTLANSPSVWFSGMYAESDGEWGTWIGANQPAVP